MTFEQFMKLLEDRAVAEKIYQELVQADGRVWIVIGARLDDVGEAELEYQAMNVVEITKYENAALGLAPGGWMWCGEALIFRTA